MIDDPGITVKGLLKHIKGPDFPTGGQLLSTRKELEKVYTDGSGSLKLRGDWNTESSSKGPDRIIVTSIPYAVKRATVVEMLPDPPLGEHAASGLHCQLPANVTVVGNISATVAPVALLGPLLVMRSTCAVPVVPGV